MIDLTGDMPATYSDAGKRCSDVINMHALVKRDTKDYSQQWVAIRLADGGSDGNLYDSRADAIRHQKHEKLCCYVFIAPDGMTPQEADVFMAFNRAAYDNGWNMTDPGMIPPLTKEAAAKAMRQLRH